MYLINHVQCVGSIPLHLAALEGHMDATRFFVEECGVARDARDKVRGVWRVRHACDDEVCGVCDTSA